jgi:hypothetical protein
MERKPLMPISKIIYGTSDAPNIMDLINCARENN